MISYSVYRLIHFFGIFLLITALGGAVMAAMIRGAALTASAEVDALARRSRRLIAASHGIAMLLILVGGFGMLARLDVGFPTWVVAKLLVWVALGAMLGLANKLVGRARALWFAVPVLAFVAAWLAYTKPF